MSQPKIIVAQLDTGTGPTSLVVQSDLFPVGSGRIEHGHYTPILPMSGTSIIPHDNTTPLITEGTEIASIIHTPTIATDKFRAEICCSLSGGSNNTNVIIALFRDSTCLCCSVASISFAGRIVETSFVYHDAPPSVSTHVYSLRVGSDSGQTWYVNSNPAGNTLGGTWVSSFGVEEMA